MQARLKLSPYMSRRLSLDEVPAMGLGDDRAGRLTQWCQSRRSGDVRAASRYRDQVRRPGIGVFAPTFTVTVDRRITRPDRSAIGADTGIPECSSNRDRTCRPASTRREGFRYLTAPASQRPMSIADGHHVSPAEPGAKAPVCALRTVSKGCVPAKSTPYGVAIASVNATMPAASTAMPDGLWNVALMAGSAVAGISR